MEYTDISEKKFADKTAARESAPQELDVMRSTVKAQEELRDSERRFKDIAMLLPAVICEWDASFKLTYMNIRGFSLFRLTKEQFDRGVYLFDMIDPPDRTKAEKDLHNIFHGDFGNAMEYCVKRQDGKPLHVLVNSTPIMPEGGIRMCIVDISDRVEAEQNLRESEKRFKSIVSWSPIGIALWDKAGTIKEMNTAFSGLFNLHAGVVAGEASFSVIRLLNLPKNKLLRLESGESIEHETITTVVGKNRVKEGLRNLAWHLTPLGKSRKSHELFLVQVQDITEKKRAEDARIKHVQQEADDARQEVANLRKEIRDRATFQNMVSRSPLMKEIFDILPVVADAPATVLITGESGTGKELIARSLHELSGRKNKPFVAINCSALPDALLESELFGYKAGAFTDAKKDKPGTFARANGGTIFLDEIGDISAAMQAKLLRVIQEKTFEPLGAVNQVKVDLRIIAATNKDLGERVKKGEFREDLFYRINVLVIKLPPLCDRRCDIPVLVHHFIDNFNSRYNKEIQSISKDAENALLAYDFPGNIRELQNIIEHAFIFCKDPVIGLCHLPPMLRGGSAGTAVQSISHIKDFDELEKLYLQSVLAEAGGSRMRAAQKLGIHKATLFRKMRKFGL
jgi:PAS domain S-box-containing protein